MQRVGAGTLQAADVDRRVQLAGWVHRVRDHGGLLFFDLRDRSGIVQVVVSPQDPAYSAAQALHPEWVVAVEGTVRRRQSGAVNPKLPTGEIEIESPAIEILAQADVPPLLPSAQESPDEALRLRYRVLDLRRQEMQENLALRHRLLQATRRHLDEAGFYELETPMLTRSTPEGARDFLVPSRLQPGAFYALPQSPQLFKQLLMVAGFERYFQVVRCFRDEDLRADRQPEFTQIDIEMSFVEQEDVLHLAEGLMQAIAGEAGWQFDLPLPRLTYQEAMLRFGSDKPDLRIPCEIQDLLAFKDVFTVPFLIGAVEAGGVLRGLKAPGAAGLSRKQWDELGRQIERFGFKSVPYLALQGGELKGSLAKGVDAAEWPRLREGLRLQDGDAALVLAGDDEKVSLALGHLRLTLADMFGWRSGEHRLLWVTDFPLMEWSEEEGRAVSRHHPFTHPNPADVGRLEAEPLAVRAQAYDLVLDGVEVAGGSIRIHERELQERVFHLLGLGEEEAQGKFGFLLDAFRFGAPPHGGVAFGFDRLCMLLAGASSIRDVIAFPKTAKGTDLLTGAPAEVSSHQLEELHLDLRPAEEKA